MDRWNLIRLKARALLFIFASQYGKTMRQGNNPQENAPQQSNPLNNLKPSPARYPRTQYTRHEESFHSTGIFLGFMRLGALRMPPGQARGFVASAASCDYSYRADCRSIADGGDHYGRHSGSSTGCHYDQRSSHGRYSTRQT